MSTLNNLAALTQILADPRKVAFVEELTEKTKQGRVPWVNRNNAVTATLPGGLEINFVTSPTLGGGVHWQLFTLRDSRGNELIKISPAPLLPFLRSATPVPGGTDSLEQAVGELFSEVNKSASEGLERAISTIKNL